MTNDVASKVNKFILLGELEQKVYTRLGIPTGLIYKYESMVNGQVDRHMQPITIEELKREYNLDGIIKARLTWGLGVYLSLTTYYTDSKNDWSEEVLKYQVDKDFLQRLKAKGFDTEYHDTNKTMGYGFFGDEAEAKKGFFGDESAFFKIFEGYPNTSRLGIDWFWQVVKRAVTVAMPDGKPIEIALRNVLTEETSTITFESREEFLKFLTQDGVMTYMSANGRVAFRFTSTIYGENRASVVDHQTRKFMPLSGLHVTSILLPQMPIFI